MATMATTTKKPKRERGRPELPPALKRTEMIRVMLTKAERRALESAAERDRRTLSDWLRNVALNAAEPD